MTLSGATRLRQSGRVQHDRSDKGERRKRFYAKSHLNLQCNSSFQLRCAGGTEKRWSSGGLGLIVARSSHRMWPSRRKLPSGTSKLQSRSNICVPIYIGEVIKEDVYNVTPSIVEENNKLVAVELSSWLQTVFFHTFNLDIWILNICFSQAFLVSPHSTHDSFNLKLLLWTAGETLLKR